VDGVADIVPLDGSDASVGIGLAFRRDRMKPRLLFPRRLLIPLALSLAGVLAALALSGAAPGSDSTLPVLRDSADIASSIQVPGPGQREVLPAPAQAFRAGESLKFSVRYGIIHAGNAWLEIPEVRRYQGHEVYLLLARAESNAFFSRFYKVRERIESYWDRHGRYSRRYTEDRREGKFRQQSDIVFDPVRNEAVYSDGRTFPVPARVQDALSAFYYFRTQALPLGGSIVFHYHASRKSQPLQVKVLGRERIETPAGTFNCVGVEPVLKAGGIFKSSGRLVIWVTDDERRMPVLMKSKVAIGSISVELVEARAGG
jgi:hypothetical protein